MIVVNQRDFGRFRSERRLKLLGKILIFVKSDAFSWDFSRNLQAGGSWLKHLRYEIACVQFRQENASEIQTVSTFPSR